MSKSLVFEESKTLSIDIINIYKYLTKEKREFIMSKQLLRAGTSIGANIAEGLQAISKKEFIMKMNISLKEAVETLYWIEILIKGGYLKQSEVEKTVDKTEKIKAMLINIIKTSKLSLQ